MMLCEKSFRPFSKRSEGMSGFTATLAYVHSNILWICWCLDCEYLFICKPCSGQSSATVSCRDRRLQDGAPAHRSRKTVAFLTAHIADFDEPENWPPNSPDLNRVDYLI